jgi:hypothetical protein
LVVEAGLLTSLIVAIATGGTVDVVRANIQAVFAVLLHAIEVGLAIAVAVAVTAGVAITITIAVAVAIAITGIARAIAIVVTLVAGGDGEREGRDQEEGEESIESHEWGVSWRGGYMQLT